MQSLSKLIFKKSNYYYYWVLALKRVYSLFFCLNALWKRNNASLTFGLHYTILTLVLDTALGKGQ